MTGGSSVGRGTRPSVAPVSLRLTVGAGLDPKTPHPLASSATAAKDKRPEMRISQWCHITTPFRIVVQSSTNMDSDISATAKRLARQRGAHRRSGDEQLGDLDGIQSCTLAQVVIADEQHQTAAAVD